MPLVDIRHNQRVAYIGKTGSGKTFLAQHNLQMIPRLIAFDPKGTLGGSKWNLDTGQSVKRRLEHGDAGRLRVTGIVDPKDWIPWLEFAWKIRNVIVYIDEMSLVNPGTRPSLQLARLYQIGRELGIGVQAATQRPRNVPAVMFSEADWIFAFRMSRAEDRKTVADYGDEYETMRKAIHDRYGFYTYTPTWRRPVYTSKYTPQPVQVYENKSQVRIAGKAAS